MQTGPELPKQPAAPQGQEPLPVTVLIGIKTFREAAQAVADILGQPIAICHRPSEAQTASRIPFVNRLLAEFKAEPQGMVLIEVINPKESVASANPVVAAVTGAVKALPLNQRDAVTNYFGLDGKPSTQPPVDAAATMDFLAGLRNVGGDPNALTQLLSQSPTIEQPTDVADALRAMRKPRMRE